MGRTSAVRSETPHRRPARYKGVHEQRRIGVNPEDEVRDRNQKGMGRLGRANGFAGIDCGRVNQDWISA